MASTPVKEAYLERQDSLVEIGHRDDLSVSPLSLTREPLQKGGCIGHFAFGFDKSFAIFQTQDEGEIVDMLPV